MGAARSRLVQNAPKVAGALSALENPETATNLVMPRPCKFISTDLPLCSIIRPTSIPLAGAVAAAHFLTDTGLFHGQSNEFFDFLFTSTCLKIKDTQEGVNWV